MIDDSEPIIEDEPATVTITFPEFTEERVAALFGQTLWPDVIGDKEWSL